MKKIRLLLLLSVFVGVNIITYSEPIKLTLEESIKLAYKKSYTLENADLEVENTEYQVSEAYKEALPKIDYTGEYNKSERDVYGDLFSADQNYSHSIDLTQPIFRGGQIKAGINAAKYIKERSSLNYDTVRDELRVLIVEKYTTILAEQRSLEVYKASLKEVETQYNRAKRRYELKLIAKSEVLPLQTNVINTKTNIIETENSIKVAELELKNELRIPRDQEIVLEKIDLDKYSIQNIDIEKDVNYARENNKEARIAELDKKISKEQETEARAAFLPEVDARFGYRTEDAEDFSDSTDDWEWNAGVTVTMNLFSFGQDLDAYRRSKNETEIAENTKKDTSDDVEVEVRSLYVDLLRLDGTVREQEVAVESARENYELEKKRHENGLTDAIDFLVIENTLREAELNLITTRLDYYLAFERYIEAIK